MGCCFSNNSPKKSLNNSINSNNNAQNNNIITTPNINPPNQTSQSQIQTKPINIPINQGISQTNINNNENNSQVMKQVSIQEAIDFLTNEALIPLNQLESAHHYLYHSNDTKLIGPINYPKNFVQPNGWTAIALKVSKKYDGGDDTWLENSNKDGVWYVGFHGVKTLNSINNIFFMNFLKGPRQECKNDNNTNPLTIHLFPKCGVGAYFAQNINEAKTYCDNILYKGINYKVVLMCRLNPNKVRISNKGINNDYMIVNGNKDEVRPYKILLIKE